MAINTCCCCIELRLGCFIIGYINLIIGMVYSGLCIFALILSIEGMKSLTDTEYENFGTILIITVVVLTVAYVLQVIITIVLLAGLHQNKRSYVNIYVKFNIFIIGLIILLSVISLSQSGIDPGELIQDIISIVINIYFLLVIRSYCLRMEEENDAAKPNYSVSYRANV